METNTNLNQIIHDNLQVVKERLQGTAGAISISKCGEIGFGFNTTMMPWAYIKDAKLHFGLRAGEDECIV